MEQARKEALKNPQLDASDNLSSPDDYQEVKGNNSRAVKNANGRTVAQQTQTPGVALLGTTPQLSAPMSAGVGQQIYKDPGKRIFQYTCL